MSRILAYQGDHCFELESAAVETLLETLRRGGVQLSAPCGGGGKCGKCRVELQQDGRRESVLACQYRAEGDCTVYVPALAGGSICTEGQERTLSFTPGRSGLGAAVDIGTTTVAVRLYDLADGSLLGTDSAWNAQAAFGADVISRCQYVMEHEDGLALLRESIRDQVFSLAGGLIRAAGREEGELSELYIAGNTVMEHIFMGLSPAGLAVAPFRAESLFTGEEAKQIRGVKTWAAPCAASYVGGDIMAGLLSTGLWQKPGVSLFLDVGTNGEMALGGREGFVCCAVASGPAFEGAGIRCGMASTPGAVANVCWAADGPELTVIGGGEAKGLCGSGLIKLLALLLEKGLVDETGWLLPPEEAPAGYEKWLSEDENGNGCFHLSSAVFLSAADVRQLQLAKAAVAAGIQVLLEEAGLTAGEIDRVYLAGGFGTHLDPQAAAAIGMLPEELAGKTVSVGNSALAGAAMALLDGHSRAAMDEIQKQCKYIELSGDSRFNRAFPQHMMFCEEDELEWN